MERGKPENPKKNPQRRAETNKKFNSHTRYWNRSAACGIGGLAGKRAKRDTKARNATTCTCDRVSRSCITLRGLAPSLFTCSAGYRKGRNLWEANSFRQHAPFNNQLIQCSFVPAENHTYNEKLISYYINFDLNNFFPAWGVANTCFCCCCHRSDFNHIDCFITRTLVRFAIV